MDLGKKMASFSYFGGMRIGWISSYYKVFSREASNFLYK